MVNVNRLEIVFTNPLQITEVDPPKSGSQFVTVTYEKFSMTAEGDYIMYTLPVDHFVAMKVSYVDAKGNPATIDGEVSWSSSDESILLVNPDENDSTLARCTPVGGLGVVQITASCDADLGDGVRELITLADVEVVGGEAVSGTISPVSEPVQIEPKA